MDASTTEQQMDDMVTKLFSYDPVERNAVINQYYSVDVTYKHPLWNVQGPTGVKKVYDLWANLNAKPSKILDVVFDGSTCVVRTQLLVCPRIFPLLTFKVPATTILKFELLSDKLYVVHQEDAWTIQDLIESVPFLGWWYKHLVIPTLSVLLLGTSDAVKQAMDVNQVYVHPVVQGTVAKANETVGKGQAFIGNGVQGAIHTGAKVAGTGYQLALDGTGLVLDKASVAAGQGYAVAKAYQEKVEGVADEIRHEGARQAGVVTGATKTTFDATYSILMQYVQMALEKAKATIGMAEGVLDEGKQRVKANYDMGQQKANQAVGEAKGTYNEASETAEKVKEDALSDFNKGYEAGGKKGLGGLGSWWVDKTGTRQYVENAKGMAYQGKDAAISNANNVAAMTDGKLDQMQGYADGTIQPLQDKYAAGKSIASDGFAQGRGLGKDLEENGPEYAKNAYGEAVITSKNYVKEGVEMTQGALENGKDVLSDAQIQLEEVKPANDTTTIHFEAALPVQG